MVNIVDEKEYIKDRIEPIKVCFKSWNGKITVYRTPETRRFDEEFNPADLYEKVGIQEGCGLKGKLWRFTGKAEAEYALNEFLFLQKELGYFVAVTSDTFKKQTGIEGYDLCIDQEKIEVVKGGDAGDFVILSKKALKNAERNK